jgi:hypothetical protein
VVSKRYPVEVAAPEVKEAPVEKKAPAKKKVEKKDGK